MKKIALSVAALALTAGSALAADLPSRKAPAYIPPPPPPPMWTGFYVGLNAGGTFGGSNSVNVVTASLVPAAGVPGIPFIAGAQLAALGTGTGSIGSASGFIGGGQVGYNWQFYNNFVVGVEADIQGVAGSGGGQQGFTTGGIVNAAFPTTSTIAVTKSLDYIGTVRGRLGWLFTPTLLLYGTGGLAYGGVSNTATLFQASPAAGNFVGLGSTSFADTRTGWTAGGGVEWMFMPNWSAKVEYLYYDLGSVSQNFVNTATFAAVVPSVYAATQTTTRYDGHIVRAGLNYHFNWGAPAPVVAKY